MMEQTFFYLWDLMGFGIGGWKMYLWMALILAAMLLPADLLSLLILRSIRYDTKSREKVSFLIEIYTAWLFGCGLASIVAHAAIGIQAGEALPWMPYWGILIAAVCGIALSALLLLVELAYSRRLSEAFTAEEKKKLRFSLLLGCPWFLLLPVRIPL